MLFAKPNAKHLLFSDAWPAATSYLCDSEIKKVDRASQIFKHFVKDVSGKRVLDFGCGEGHLVSFVKKFATIAIGYDIVDAGCNDCFCDWEKILSFAPYDIVILHDVIDHAADEKSAIEILRKSKSVLNDRGVILARCHPFCSRTGSHQFQWLNKAYLHLAFTEEELAGFGIGKTNVLQVMRPQYFYGSLFNQVNLLVVDRIVEYCFVEKFFEENYEVKNRILKNWEDLKGFPYHQMEQHYVFYKLIKND